MPLAIVVLVNTGVRWHLFQDPAMAELHLLTSPEASHRVEASHSPEASHNSITAN